MKISKVKFESNLAKKWYIAGSIGFFIPLVGIILVIINTVIDNKYCTKNNKAILYTAICDTFLSLFMGGYILLVSIEISSSAFLAFLYIPAFFLGIYMFVVYFIFKKRANSINTILTLVKESHITSVLSISDIAGLDKNKTIKLINMLISTGDLDGASINKMTLEIEFEKCVWAHQLCICNTCGASIYVNFGQTLVCEYCSGALDIKRVKVNE